MPDPQSLSTIEAIGLPLTPFATVHLKQGLEELLQRPVDLVRLRVNPALWNTEE